MKSSLVMIALFLGCAPSAEGGILGRSSDVTTSPGRYGEYSVFADDCGVMNGFPVSATGNVPLSAFQHTEDLHQRFQSLEAYHGSPTFGGECGRLTATVRLNDWGSVDEAIELAGGYLVENEQNGVILIKVVARGED